MATFISQRVVSLFTRIEADSPEAAQVIADALAMEKDGIIDSKVWTIKDGAVLVTVEEDDPDF